LERDGETSIERGKRRGGAQKEKREEEEGLRRKTPKEIREMEGSIAGHGNEKSLK